MPAEESNGLDLSARQREVFGTESARVSEITKKHGAFFIHGIHPNFSPGANTLLYPRVPWQKKLDVLLAFSPTLSASTIRPGEEWHVLWSRMGVVLSDGEVEAAFSADAGTQANSLTERKMSVTRSSSIAQAITRSGPQPGQTGIRYNEFVVSRPEMAGFYICMDDTGVMTQNDLVPTSQIVDETEKRKIPLFVILGGQLFAPPKNKLSVLGASLEAVRQRVSQKGGEETIGYLLKHGWKPINHGDIGQYKVETQAQTLEQIQQEILTGRVFNLAHLSERVPEINEVMSFGQGRQTCLEVFAQQEIRRLGGKEITYQGIRGQGKDDKYYPTKGQRVTEVASFTVGDRDIRYIVWNKRLFREMNDQASGIKDLEEINWRTFRSGHINLGFNTLRVGGALNYGGDYLTAMGAVVRNWQSEINKLAAEGKTDLASSQRLYLRRMALHIYGFGYQAGLVGDQELIGRSIALATQIMPEAEIKELLSRRLDEKGRFKLNVADLG